MRLSNAAHQSHPWIIAQIAPDFRLLDVWVLPVHGARDDFRSLIDRFARIDVSAGGSRVSAALFRIRFRLGALLGWDDPRKRRTIPGSAETSLRERLTEELRRSVDGVSFGAAMSRAAGGFTPLYRTDREFAAEIANDTVHGVLQIAWLEEQHGRYRARLAVYVKPRGMRGEAYLKLIQPFRHLIVYPSLTKQVGRMWESGRESGA
ncbi:MAG TPA: DUF2867 domain-containing protein [Actinomycetota bacterium]|nr:DUF2867 domain-containing protein [Actinomycetota bacterium]